MSPNRSLRRMFPAALLAVLVLAGLPLQAQPARRSPSGIGKAAVLGESALAWAWERLARLWGGEMAKEGPLIDPDGRPQGQPNDEGITIDPNG